MKVPERASSFQAPSAVGHYRHDCVIAATGLPSCAACVEAVAKGLLNLAAVPTGAVCDLLQQPVDDDPAAFMICSQPHHPIKYVVGS